MWLDEHLDGQSSFVRLEIFPWFISGQLSSNWSVEPQDGQLSHDMVS
jgi:hypothetical protein